jgi:hypothetical protein
VDEELRFDRGAISPNWEKTPEGYLRVKGTFSRVGCLSYKRHDGTTQVEYRPEEEVAHRDSILSLGGLPVTLEHPPELLTPANTRQYARGSTGTVVNYDNGFVEGVVTLTDADAIAAVERGDARELSVGYRVQIDRTPGVTASGERYDAIQRRISGNHVALTREGRSGPEVRLHMDSAFSIDPPSSFSFSPSTPPLEAHEMTTAVAALSSATETLANALAAQSRSDARKRPPMPADEMDPEEEGVNDPEGDQETPEEEAMEGDETSTPMEKPAGKRGRRDSVVSRQEYDRVVNALAERERAHEEDLGRMDAISERLDELESDLSTRLDTSEIDIDALVSEKLELLEKANALAGERLDHSGLSPRELQIEAMERSGVAIERFDGKSDEYVAAAFDTYCDAGPTGRFDGATALEILLGSTTAAPETDPRKDMIERQKRASQQPLTHHV